MLNKDGNDIDKDIEIVEEKIKALNLHILNYKKSYCATSFYRTLIIERNALVNVLNRLKEYDSKIIHLSDEEYRKVIDNAQADLKSELEIKDKMIDSMADYIAEKSNFCANKCCMNEDCHDNDCVKEYFRKKAEEC